MIITENTKNRVSVEEKDMWETPDHIYQKLDGLFHFTLDPCCTKESKKCSTFFTPEVNGLAKDWSGHTVFMNPPYSRYNIDMWIKKAIHESRHANVVALVAASTSSDWFRSCIGNTFYWVDKRIRFKNAPFIAPFSSVIIHFNGVNENKSFNQ